MADLTTSLLRGDRWKYPVTDEGGKINVNKISRENLVRALSILEIKGAERGHNSRFYFGLDRRK